MLYIDSKISRKELSDIAKRGFGNMIKAVIDIEKQVMMIDAPLHADLESQLISFGSKQDDIWGINLYPDFDEKDFIQYDSIINIRPNQGNFNRCIEDPEICKRIKLIISDLVK